jgi:N-ethylmaleimide reductase
MMMDDMVGSGFTLTSMIYRNSKAEYRCFAPQQWFQTFPFRPAGDTRPTGNLAQSFPETKEILLSQPLLEPYRLGALRLPNRVVMAPMNRGRIDNPERAPTPLVAEYYAQRASAGLIIGEGTFINDEAISGINVPGICSAAQIAGWRLVTDAVHQRNGRIYAQLSHVGPVSHPDLLDGKTPLGPSAINPQDKVFTDNGFTATVTPREMTPADIARTIADFAQATRNAVAAGFDGVEIHAAQGFLLPQFFSRRTNRRSDAYGGSIEKRTRILFDILDAIIPAIGADRVAVKLNPSIHGLSGVVTDEETIPAFDHIVTRLNEFGLAYLHLQNPANSVKGTAVECLDGDGTPRHFRPLYKGTLIANGGYDQQSGNRILSEGLADMLAYGRHYIANPDLVERFAASAPLAPSDPAIYYTVGAKGFTDYPALSQSARA